MGGQTTKVGFYFQNFNSKVRIQKKGGNSSRLNVRV